MTHAIVTTVDGAYSKYLPDWADGVASQTVTPDQVVIVDNGADDPQAVQDAAETTGAEVIATSWRLNRGRARNIAVAATRTEWVQHFDCDDIMHPWAIEHTDQFRDDADVVGWGWERWAEEDVRYRPYTRIYERHRGPQTLAATGPASGPSPFRRALWDQAPYRDDMPGAWDTALWLGFAHLDARFVPTSRPVFRYRFHRDSIFQTRKRSGDRRVGRRLQQLRTAPPPDVAVVVPLRTDDPDRLAAAEWLEGWYADHFPEWRWVVADCDGAWNKPRALNTTIRATDARTLVVSDADLYVHPDALREAVHKASHVPWVIPHGKVHRLTRSATQDVFAGADPDPDRCHMAPYRGTEGGGLFVLSKPQWQAAGGMDERFEGWGCEDDAFGIAANTLLGDRVRGDVPLWHLWHDPGARSRDPSFSANRRRLAAYRKASGNREAMAELVGTDYKEHPVGTYLNRRTGKTVTVDPASASAKRLERLSIWEALDGPVRTFEHSGGGWYEILEGGEVVDKVRGREAAEAAV